MDVAIRALNGLLMIAMPIALGIFLARRTGQRWRLYLAGGALFIGSQVLHVPFNLIVLNPVLAQLGFAQGALGLELVAGGMLAGLSAGIFEEVTRWLGLRFWLKDARSWRASLMYGVGWGGIEAVLLGAGVLWFLVQALLFKQGVLQSLIPADQMAMVESQFAAYWGTPLLVNLLGAVERVFAITLHLSLSVMVMRVFTHRKRLWLAAAIAWHALADAAALIAALQIGAVEAEAIVAVMGAASLAIIFRLREEEPLPDEAVLAAQELEFKPVPVQVTDKKLEDSRYSS